MATAADPSAVDIGWHPTRPAADALAEHARALLGPGVVTSGRLCPLCASARHGRPWLRYDDRPLPVSLSRASPHLVTVISAAPVGIDVESVVALDRAWDPALVLAPGEQAHTTLERARTWVRKEAVLKARGTGLTTPMCSVRLAEEDWYDLDAPDGFVAALAGAGAGPGEVTTAQPAARSI